MQAAVGELLDLSRIDDGLYGALFADASERVDLVLRRALRHPAGRE